MLIKILKKQKEQKEKEEQSKEAIEVEEEKTTLEKKLLSFPVKEALEVFADAVLASVSHKGNKLLSYWRYIRSSLKIRESLQIEK